jgi:hypothetical protein
MKVLDGLACHICLDCICCEDSKDRSAADIASAVTKQFTCHAEHRRASQPPIGGNPIISRIFFVISMRDFRHVATLRQTVLAARLLPAQHLAAATASGAAELALNKTSR